MEVNLLEKRFPNNSKQTYCPDNVMRNHIQWDTINNAPLNYFQLYSNINNPLTSKPARLGILLCLMPDCFSRQWGTHGSQWDNIIHIQFKVKSLFEGNGIVSSAWSYLILFQKYNFLRFKHQKRRRRNASWNCSIFFALDAEDTMKKLKSVFFEDFILTI